MKYILLALFFATSASADPQYGQKPEDPNCECPSKTCKLPEHCQVGADRNPDKDRSQLPQGVEAPASAGKKAKQN